jgi:hypothetical protein
MELPKVIDEVLRFSEASPDLTRGFEKFEHNKDLCPQCERQLGRILNCFEKYEQIAYDIQGPRDQGTDVLVACDTNAGDRRLFVSLQIKSFRELESGDQINKLRLQYFDSQKAYHSQLAHFYILLCTNPKKHIAKIRAIKEQFRTFRDVTVIDPGYAYTFLSLSEQRLAIVVDSVLKRGDTVVQKANEAVTNLTATEIAVILAVANFRIVHGNSPTIDDLERDAFLTAVYDRIPGFPREYYFYMEEREIEEFEDEEDRAYWKKEFTPPPTPVTGYTPERLAADLEQFELYKQEISIDDETLKPIQALLLDASVRYSLNGKALADYVFGRLRAASNFMFEPPDEELDST